MNVEIDNTLLSILKLYGTPLYVFDTGAFIKRLKKIKEILGPKIELCYSVKANPFLISAASKVVDKLEVCSPGELEICENLQVPMNKIVYSGINKEPSDIHQAINDGIKICTAESIRHVHLLNEEGKQLGQKISVLLRLNAGSQFGMSKNDLLSIIANHKDFPYIDIEGIHYFVGTQRKNSKFHKQIKELEMLHDLYKEIRTTYNLEMPLLEYGPGLPVPLFQGEDFSDTLAPMRELASELIKTSEWVKLTIESGRFFATECGYYLTKIMDKKNVDDKTYCIADGGIHHVNYYGQLMGMKIPIIWHYRGDNNADKDYADVNYQRIIDDETHTYALCGSLCTTNDDLVRNIKMAEIQLGDILVFTNIGAYSVTEAMYLFLSRPMPKIVLFDSTNGTVKLARDTVKTSKLNTELR